MKRVCKLGLLAAVSIGLTLAALSVNADTSPELPSGATLVKQLDAQNYLLEDNHMYIAKISGNSFEQLGEHYGSLLKSQLRNQLTNEEASTGFKPDGLIAGGILQNFINSHDLTNEEQDFLSGESKASGLDMRSVLYLNLSFLFSITDRSSVAHATNSPMCSFVAKQTSQGTVVGRNLDWVKKFHGDSGQGPVVITVMNLQDGQAHNKVAGIGYLGWFDAATAVNDKGLFAEVNSGQASVNSTMDSNDSPGLTSHYYSFLMRDNTLQDLEKDVQSEQPNTGYIANIAGPASGSVQGSMFSIEKGIAKIDIHSGIVNKQSYETQSLVRSGASQTYYDVSPTPGLLVATNSFRIPGWDKYLLSGAYLSSTPYPSLDEDTKSKSFHRYNNLMQLASDAQTWQSNPDQTMQSILDTPLQQDGSGGATETGLDPDNIDYTYYSVVFNTQTKTLYVNDPVSQQGWVTLSAQDLFN